MACYIFLTAAFFFMFLSGDGALGAALREQAAALGLNEMVHFLGKCSDDELKNRLQSCDFLMLPSVSTAEAFGLVQLEAMVYGKPVINTSLSSGVPCVSLNGLTGLTVPPGDADALAKAMQTLADDDALRSRLGEDAYKRVRDEFSLQKMGDRLLELYHSLSL